MSLTFLMWDTLADSKCFGSAGPPIESESAPMAESPPANLDAWTLLPSPPLRLRSTKAAEKLKTLMDYKYLLGCNPCLAVLSIVNWFLISTCGCDSSNNSSIDGAYFEWSVNDRSVQEPRKGHVCEEACDSQEEPFVTVMGKVTKHFVPGKSSNHMKHYL